MTIFNNSELLAAAHTLNDAKESFTDRWNALEVPTLDPNKFWHTFDVFRNLLKSRIPRPDAVKEAAHELFRLQAIGVDNMGSFDDLLSFVSHWEAIVDKLYTELFDVVTDKSDDSYHDLCDSLPLAGRHTVGQILDGKAVSNGDIRFLIDSHDDSMLVYIWNGENYIRMALRDTAKKWFLIHSRDHEVTESPKLV